MLVFFTKLDLMGFQLRCMALFLFFSVIGGFEWFCVGSLNKNIQLALDFLKCSFLVLHFSYYTLMTFLIMLSVILLPMLMILLSTRSVNRSDLCQHLELSSELESDLRDTADWDRKWLVDFSTGKTQLIFLLV